MATYEEIYGKRVKEFDSDPTLESSYEGQVWYDKSTGVLKSVVSFSSWSTAPATNVGATQREAASPLSNADAAILAGGINPTGDLQSTETWNGLGFSISPNLGTARRAFGSSSQTATASVVFGGNPTMAHTEEWNGSSWSEQNNLATARQYLAGFGSQTSAVAAGGYTPSTNTGRTLVEEYDGTSWTSGGALPAATFGAKGQGASETAGFVVYPAPSPSKSYDGSSWTDTGSLNTARSGVGLSGTVSDGLAFGGSTPPPAASTNTENYNGTSWSNNPATLATARVSNGSGFGAGTNALACAGGVSPYPVIASEEFSTSINTTTGAAWASSGALNTARWGGSTMGSQTAGLFAGGATPSTKLNNSEEYDGTSWTEGNNLNTARGLMAAGGNSTQTAGLCFGGTTTTGPDNTGVTNATEEYNGTSWTSVNNMNYSVRNFGGAGTQTNAVAAGGNPGPSQYNSTTGEYDGTDWTAGTSLPTALQDNQGMTGASQSAAFFVGGEGPPGSRRTDTLEYDGTNWTAGGSIDTGVMQNGASGTLTAGLTFGGTTGSAVTTTLGYDGTSWSTRPSMATARQYAHGAGTNVATFVAGGYTPGGAITTTEDFTGATETVTASTLTSS